MRENNTRTPTKTTSLDRARIGIVASRFNSQIVEQLLTSCRATLNDYGIIDDRITVAHVPGAFEIPVAVKLLLEHNRVDAVVALGTIIRGETPHFDFIAAECARGIGSVALQTGTAVIFGILTVDTIEQAWARCSGKTNNKGVEICICSN